MSGCLTLTNNKNFGLTPADNERTVARGGHSASVNTIVDSFCVSAQVGMKCVDENGVV